MAQRALSVITFGCLAVNSLWVVGCGWVSTPQTPPTGAAVEASPSASEPAGSSGSPVITITPRAARQVKRFIREYQADEPTPGPIYLRARVVAGGCTGFMNKLDLDPNTTADDLRIESEGVTVVVDRRSALYLSGSVIDYFDEPGKVGFSVDNPNAKRPDAGGEAKGVGGE